MSWLNCGVTTQAIWPKTQKKVRYGNHTFVLMPLTKEYSASVHIELNGRIGDVEGMTLINQFLSALAWKCDEPAINHYGWSGNPIPVPVSRYRIPYGYSPSGIFPNEVYEITDKKAKLAVALYREARSIDSVPFQFLSYFKILNIFWNDKWKNGKNELIEGLRASLPDLTENDCVKRIKEIESKEGAAADYLYKSGRCAVAHAFADPIVDPDNVTDLHRLSEDLWLMRNLTVHLIEKNLGIEQSIWK
jgi:hypothetical protein